MAKHREILTALRGFAGQKLTTAEIVTTVRKTFPECNSGNVLPNDHAEGNLGACWCSRKNANGQNFDASKRIFDRVDRGIFRVREVTSEDSKGMVDQVRQFAPLPSMAREETIDSIDSKPLNPDISHFQRIGITYVTKEGKISFPSLPVGGGVYLFRFNDSTIYIGETKSFARRFREYSKGADDVWTELTISEIFVSLSPTEIFLRPMVANDEVEFRRCRRQIEKTTIQYYLDRGAKLWNAGTWRCENSYQTHRIAAIRKQITEARLRYDRNMTIRRSERLNRLIHELNQAVETVRNSPVKWPTMINLEKVR